ncbi:outer membrane protein assembly factor BamC [Enterobacteriaceae bacterium LUAb1]
MIYLVKKSTLATVAGLSVMVMLAACSSDQRYKRQVSGDETYLQAADLRELHAPTGMILPLQNSDYDVPVVRRTGATGKQLDIRPPALSLALMNGTRTQFTGNTGTLFIDKAHNIDALWSQVAGIVKKSHFPIVSQQDTQHTLTTDWVQWNRADEDQQYRGRYQITLQQQGYQQALSVTLLQLQQNNNEMNSPVQLQRYNAQMLNTLSSGLTTLETSSETAATKRNIASINVQSGADDTGLPNLILRAPFSVVWQKLPAALNKMGMEVKDSSRNQGSLNLTYTVPGESTWNSLGAKDPQLNKGDYTLQVGDLDNRSSLQFLDPKGHTLTQSQNDALVTVMQAVLNK